MAVQWNILWNLVKWLIVHTVQLIQTLNINPQPTFHDLLCM